MKVTEIVYDHLTTVNDHPGMLVPRPLGTVMCLININAAMHIQDVGGYRPLTDEERQQLRAVPYDSHSVLR